MHKSGTLAALHVYPIKSCAGISVRRLDYTHLGVSFDRELVVVDLDGNVLTQRDRPRLALVKTHILEDQSLSLSADGVTPYVVPSRAGDAHAAGTVVQVWGNDVGGIDAGDEAAAWLSSVLQTQCRLLKSDPSFERRSGEARNGSSARISFADGQPLLVISQESLDSLNERMKARSGLTVPMDRFRPNIVLSGLGAFAEDSLKTIRCGTLTLHAVEACVRCKMTLIDQESLKMGKEPLGTLATFRRHAQESSKVLFGHYFVPEASGFAEVGDTVTAE